MSGVTANDYALPNGGGNAALADPGGMTNEEKQSVGGLLRRDEARGAAVHVSYSHLPSIIFLEILINRHSTRMLLPNRKLLLPDKLERRWLQLEKLLRG